MLYNDARPLIQSGDVLAFSHEGWTSKSDLESQAVRFFTRSEFSHVALAWVVAGRVFALEAVVPMVRIYPLSKLGDFYWLPMRHPLIEQAEEYALSRIGEQYSKWEAIRGFFNRNKDDASWQCAEYVLAVLRSAGVDLACHATPTAVVRSAMGRGNPLIFVQEEVITKNKNDPE